MLFDKVYKNLLNVFFPNFCAACNTEISRNEPFICVSCRTEVPTTNFHFEAESPLKKVFFGRLKIEHATALFYFHKKGLVQKLIHKLKYKNQEKIGHHIGLWLGEELIQSNNYNHIDYVIGVPIHKSKLKTRGYNQVTLFGKAMAKKLGVPFSETILKRKGSPKTQTSKNRMDRWLALENEFELNDNLFDNTIKHVLIVDDVITTGATIEACVLQLKKAKDVKISIATMAYTV